MCDNAGCQGCARGRGSRAGGARIIDVLESPEHAPRNICLRRHVVNTEIVECFKYWVVKRHSRLLLRSDHRRCTKQAVRSGGTLVAGSSTPTSYRSAPPSESQRSCAAALCVRDSLSRRLIMRRPSTVESLSGAAAAIMVACARSGSVWGGTTSRTILLRLSPRTSTVFGGWSRYPSSLTTRPPVVEFGGCFRPVGELVQHAVNGPEPHREHREQIGKLSGQVITARPPCPIDIPGVGRLGFQPQPRRVFGRRVVSTDIGSMLSWRHRDAPFLASIRGGLGHVCDLLTAHRGFRRFR